MSRLGWATQDPRLTRLALQVYERLTASPDEDVDLVTLTADLDPVAIGSVRAALDDLAEAGYIADGRVVR